MARRCTATAHGNGIRLGVELIVTSRWLDPPPVHDRIFPVMAMEDLFNGVPIRICGIFGFHQAGWFRSGENCKSISPSL
ncbi:MAG: hypothetical protein OXC57_14870 [Rhodobacteraceae bacterium]|nr:hypothetical protein [Paracoccaceae bacterium]